MPKTARKPEPVPRGARAKTAAVSAAVSPEVSGENSARETVAWDDAVKGLGLRKRGGSRRWIVQTRVDGRTVRRTLGSSAVLTLDDARAAARQVLQELRGAAPKSEAFAPPPPRPADATVAEFASRWLTDCAQSWKPSTRRRHADNLRQDIFPTLGAVSMQGLDRRQVVVWRDALACSAGTRNRALAVLSGMCRHAEIVGLREPGTNPCRGMRRRKSAFTAHYLTAPEYRRLGRALTDWESREPEVAALLRFVALTGCRVGEARGLRWDWIDGPRAALPDSKTGAKAIWLGETVRKLLAGRQRTCAHVFAVRGRPISEVRLYTAWSAIRAEAKLESLRIHDLRHSFASVAVGAGEPLRTVSGLLGHTELKTTEGYAKFAEAPVRAAADRVGGFIAERLGEPKRGKADAAARRRDLDPADVAIVARYRKSGLTLAAFCTAHDLDADAFHRALRRVMAAGGRRAA
jgi:integrase